MKNGWAFSSVFLLCLVFSSCSKPTEPALNEDNEDSEVWQASSMETQTSPTSSPETTPTAASLALSAQPYVSPSGLYELLFPQDWNCSESGLYHADCQSPDGSAAITIRVIGTGKPLDQPAFLNLAEAEIIFTHRSKHAFNEIEHTIGLGSLTARSTWSVDEEVWQGEDYFIKSDALASHLAFSAIRGSWSAYEKLFAQVKNSLQLNAGAHPEGALYASTFKYTSPDALFTIEVPTSWTKFLDTAKVQKAQIEQFFSPDRHASIQIVVYRHEAFIKQDFKAEKTLEIMRKLYGSDMRVSHDKALPDGRERLAWYVASKKLSGISFFDSWGSSLYIFTVLWDDEFQELYQPVLERTMESFGYP